MVIQQNNIEKSLLIKKVYRLRELAYNFDCMGSPPPCKESINCTIGFIDKYDDYAYNKINEHIIRPTSYGTIVYNFHTDTRKFEVQFGKNKIDWFITDNRNNLIKEIDKVKTFNNKKEIPEDILKEFDE